VPYLSASAVVIHYEEARYQVYAPYLTLPLPLNRNPCQLPSTPPHNVVVTR